MGPTKINENKPPWGYVAVTRPVMQKLQLSNTEIFLYQRAFCFFFHLGAKRFKVETQNQSFPEINIAVGYSLARIKNEFYPR